MPARKLTLLIAATLAVGLACANPAAAQTDTATAAHAIATLNAQREAHGIPGNLIEDARMNRGCQLHLDYLARNPGEASWPDVHREKSDLPGYTELGAEAAGSNIGGLSGRPWRRDVNPWIEAPLHLSSLMSPMATTAWYHWRRTGSNAGPVCMDTRADHRNPRYEPGFYSFPGPGRTGVPTWERTGGESPWHPAEVLGVRGVNGYTWGPVTGPVVLLYTPYDVADAVRFSVTGPDGPVAARLLDGDTDTPTGPASGLLAASGVLVIVRPLRPLTSYTVTVDWTAQPDEITSQPQAGRQQFSFTTGDGPRRGLHVINPRLTLRLTRRGRTAIATIGAGAAQHRTVRLTFGFSAYPFQKVIRVRPSAHRAVVRWRMPRAVWRTGALTANVRARFRKDGDEYLTDVDPKGRPSAQLRWTRPRSWGS